MKPSHKFVFTHNYFHADRHTRCVGRECVFTSTASVMMNDTVCEITLQFPIILLPGLFRQLVQSIRPTCGLYPRIHLGIWAVCLFGYSGSQARWTFVVL